MSYGVGPYKFLFLISRKRLRISKNMLNKKCKESKDLSFDIKKKGLAPKFRDLIGFRNFDYYFFSYRILYRTFLKNGWADLPEIFRTD